MDERLARELQEHVRKLYKQFRKDMPPLERASRSAVSVLGVVARDTHASDGVTPGVIADRLGMASSNVATALRELEDAGYIMRHRASNDGRRVVVSLTPVGVSAVASHRSLRANSLLDQIETVMTPEEQALLAAAIPLLGRLIAERNSDSPS
ncbi:MAG: MarR family winged helix-turn-helix transcriptional regulator [Bifidobacterium tibiigranuli]|jgi:DNA-binding MarR family transcriptional regulator|uniref:MarR family winged helix-turn-helix transcriptional regulator n=1 Tax=Bifidobacterium tibiigranuli TaxID=2172043 RepID=UPI0026F23770|nr:MarR family winged helix-turn-helix transcriptional regulator [Bifidobacterium tibiigranuli]MCI1672677.1 MarR family winged helix-turn-helix transcriptional regulator [Bifidobacterium tibiigranuli]MCI1712318.1 MarR family winged helix-turn-helix transcriptional regulator [Bifidobacterium tibiigranuli]